MTLGTQSSKADITVNLQVNEIPFLGAHGEVKNGELAFRLLCVAVITQA